MSTLPTGNHNDLSTTNKKRQQFDLCSSEEGEIKADAIPFNKSFNRNALIEYNDKVIFVGHNEMPTYKEYTNKSRLKKDLRKKYSYIKDGDHLLEESKTFFKNNKLFLLDKIKYKKFTIDDGVKNVLEAESPKNTNNTVKYVKTHQCKYNYRELVKQLERKEEKANDDLFTKKDELIKMMSRTNKYKITIISDKQIDLYTRYDKAYVEGIMRNGQMIMKNVYVNDIDFIDYNNILLNNINRDEAGDDYVVREYIFTYKDNEHIFYIHSEGDKMSNGIDIQQTKIDINGIKVEHKFKQIETTIYNVIIESDMKNGRYLLNNKNIYEIGNVGEEIEYKEVKYDRFIV